MFCTNFMKKLTFLIDSAFHHIKNTTTKFKNHNLLILNILQKNK
jgi:hypothetical protein